MAKPRQRQDAPAVLKRNAPWTECREAGAAIVSGVAPEDVLAGMKKADLAMAAANAAQACGWLPPELRNATYELTIHEPQTERLTGKVAASEQASEAA